MSSSIRAFLLTAVLIVGPIVSAQAADPQSYRVDFASTGNAALDSTLRATSELETLRKTAPVGPLGLVARARGDIERLQTVLESFGYYQATVTLLIEGKALNGSGIADALSELPKGRDARVAASFVLGPLYHLRTVRLDGTVPASAAGAFRLESGAPAVAAEVLAAGARLQSAMQEQGYAFATVSAPVAYEDAALPVLDVTFTVDAGKQVNIGSIKFTGLGRVHPRLVRRRLTLREGQRFSPSAIEAARRDLLLLGPFATINVDVGKAVDATGGVPVTFAFTERRRHQIGLQAAYSSDLGGSAGITWTDRNVFGNAEQLSLTANLINAGGSDTQGLGYDVNGKFTIPEFGHRDQSLQFAAGVLKQYLEAYDQNAVTSSATLSRRLSSVWSASAGVATSVERVEQFGVTDNYTLVELPLALKYDSTHLASPLDDPTHGMRDSISVTPTQSLGTPSATFIITQIKLADYFDLDTFGFGAPGRSVLAGRFLAAEAAGAGEYSLPPDQRFYGGGSDTIRGYAYQTVGPQRLFKGNEIPVGGTAIVAGALEFRQRIGANWGFATFADAGQVSASLKVTPNQFRIGIGAGARYYTAIGPIRFDIAVPTQATIDGQGFQVYIGLGQAF